MFHPFALNSCHDFDIFEELFVTGYVFSFQIFDVFFDLGEVPFETHVSIDIFVGKIVFGFLKPLVCWWLRVASESTRCLRASRCVIPTEVSTIILPREDREALRCRRHFDLTPVLHVSAVLYFAKFDARNYFKSFAVDLDDWGLTRVKVRLEGALSALVASRFCFETRYINLAIEVMLRTYYVAANNGSVDGIMRNKPAELGIKSLRFSCCLPAEKLDIRKAANKEPQLFSAQQ